MDFTVITPSLNYGRFIGDCLRSVVSQQGVSLEHLVIDGGSNDETEAVVAQFPGVVWSQQPDKGMSDAINKGFDRAQGEWVIWLNADDRLKRDCLKSLLPILKASDADVVYGDWDFVNADGELTRHVTAPGWSRFVHVHHHCYVGSTAAFYRRVTIIEQGLRLREDFRYVMDGEFYARLDALGKRFEHVPVNIADFRMHGGNLSQRNRGVSQDMGRILTGEYQNAESRAIRRLYGITLFREPYLNGLMDGLLWIIAKGFKACLRLAG